MAQHRSGIDKTGEIPAEGDNRRSRGHSLERVIGELRVYLTGWRNYYSLNELPSLARNLLRWVRRRLRSLLWKQWKKGRTRYGELRARGGQ
ncbi:TPA: group II intron maturase-specific domain-containing protein [Salmonella enterica subsp. diarizonae serovar 61:l,v:z35]